MWPYLAAYKIGVSPYLFYLSLNDPFSNNMRRLSCPFDMAAECRAVLPSKSGYSMGWPAFNNNLTDSGLSGKSSSPLRLPFNKNNLLPLFLQQDPMQHYVELFCP